MSALKIFSLFFIGLASSFLFAKSEKDSKNSPKSPYRIHQVELSVPSANGLHSKKKAFLLKKVLLVNQNTGETFFLKVTPLGNEISYCWVKIKDESSYRKNSRFNQKPLSL